MGLFITHWCSTQSLISEGFRWFERIWNPEPYCRERRRDVPFTTSYTIVNLDWNFFCQQKSFTLLQILHQLENNRWPLFHPKNLVATRSIIGNQNCLATTFQIFLPEFWELKNPEVLGIVEVFGFPKNPWVSITFCCSPISPFRWSAEICWKISPPTVPMGPLISRRMGRNWMWIFRFHCWKKSDQAIDMYRHVYFPVLFALKFHIFCDFLHQQPDGHSCWIYFFVIIFARSIEEKWEALMNFDRSWSFKYFQ